VRREPKLRRVNPAFRAPAGHGDAASKHLVRLRGPTEERERLRLALELDGLASVALMTIAPSLARCDGTSRACFTCVPAVLRITERTIYLAPEQHGLEELRIERERPVDALPRDRTVEPARGG
jgi:hypothetical protein